MWLWSIETEMYCVCPDVASVETEIQVPSALTYNNAKLKSKKPQGIERKVRVLSV